MNPLLKIQEFGQSIWLDYLRRNIIVSGGLERLIEEDGLRGVTSNPSIFEKAIAGSHDYDDDIRTLSLEGKDPFQIYEDLTVEDIRNAADIFRPVFDKTKGADGFVSLEVSPFLANDTEGSIKQARHLWSVVGRPNLMIKIPATKEGVPAIQRCLEEGININITLLFGIPRYREVAEAYLAALENRSSAGKPLQDISSVASFFLSRIDTLVDPQLEKIKASGSADAGTAASLIGETAIAGARAAYRIYKELFGSERFRELAGKGARTQRLLWASTSTKNPAYSDVKYVEALIGPETINTLPLETINAYREHGRPESRLETGMEQADQKLAALGKLKINIDQVTRKLEEDGIKKFKEPFEKLIDSIKRGIDKSIKGPLDTEKLRLGDDAAGRREVDLVQARDVPLQRTLKPRLEEMKKDHFPERLWKRDPSLWKQDPGEQKSIRQGLGWLHVAEKMEAHADALVEFAREIKRDGFRHVVHMGMGGSSLAPLVFQKTFRPGQDGIPITVLDTTDPATILEIENSLPLKETLFIAASKSGTTAEPIAFEDYFYDKLRKIKDSRAGENFVVITDPDTPLQGTAEERKYRRCFLNYRDIVGRYSALSCFGLVPAVLLGVDIKEILARALRMAHACSAAVPVEKNPALMLGAAMAELALRGRDKLTFLLPSSISSLAMWLEQLIAESTGKEGVGIIPIAGEDPGEYDVYGEDRLFAHIGLKKDPDPGITDTLRNLIACREPVVDIHLEDELDIGQEFFRWEMATAVAGSILGINAFDQPNVQESKDNTNVLLEEASQTGSLAQPGPVLREGGLSFYGPAKKAGAVDYLADFFSQRRTGDYIALQAYLTESPETESSLQGIRTKLRDTFGLATTLGYGPRYLHSTGQIHKGGPDSGLFIQFTADDRLDAPIPGRKYGFGTFRQAQALGDFEALRKHGRRVIKVNLGPDMIGGLKQFRGIMDEALSGA